MKPEPCGRFANQAVLAEPGARVRGCLENLVGVPLDASSLVVNGSSVVLGKPVQVPPGAADAVSERYL